jgi:uncharacterized membrane protein YdbT with pleckstrin-like domain
MNPNQPQSPQQPGQRPQPSGYGGFASQQPPPQPGQPQPVAYDQYGNPLYAHPPQQPVQPQFVHLARAMQPMDTPIPAEVKARHDESRKHYPHINLSPGEYVISHVHRHPIGLIKILLIGLTLILALMAMYVLAFAGPDNTSQLAEMEGAGMAILGVLIVLVAGGTFIAAYVYNSNRFFLTNESVIQEIQDSLFARHEQTVSLSNIEDASFKQGGILPTLFNYGTIRLSTEGDETTYRFSYVSNPKNQISLLNNAVEAFKNGRPVD